ncbi:MAG TPA: PEP-CTERM sorting domain-containing protein [Rubrivivax sp.]|jgi:hypothetical protein|nr:PEP-CTERM sorting domain-containing protein [Rhodoferax sp.]HMR69875.1 PEP-CTERM sorting domain-containing protein [Rubrivivax sp.]
MMKFKPRAAIAAIAAGFGALALASAAQAFPIYEPITVFEDDNLEYLSLDANTNGNLDVGDQLRGVVDFTKIYGAFGGGPTDLGAPELTALFELQVSSKVATATPGKFNFTFAPTAGFTATYGAGAMVAVFEDPSDDLQTIGTPCASIAACETAATNGTHVLTLGFNDADDFWLTSDAVESFAAVAGLPAATKVGFNNYLLSILFNNTPYTWNQQDASGVYALLGLACADDCLVDVIGSGDSLGGQGLTNGYQARSDIDAQIAFIPEPGALGLAGLALAGLGLARRRRSIAR